MVDQIVTKIRYKNINTYEFVGHSYINLIKVCDFQNFIHDNPEKQKLKKKTTTKFHNTKLYNTSTTKPAPRLRGGYAPSLN